MKRYRYKNAVIRVRGEVDRDRVERAAIQFMKKAEICKRKQKKGKNQNGNVNSSRTISK